eukprot:CAMPEP_0179349458 /NCGR_PEP_ID=MMETSP0797-20121207/74244_1 /TAXON_ID=47934 /ORGANISM="Dinophysis acuminata, Strain DAEP01" /LENGTH=122 /DNA_ID=CAMNT_0021064327 /DNA_START=204 /DNA_END=569 /DNA_ORIENTATION=+
MRLLTGLLVDALHHAVQVPILVRALLAALAPLAEAHVLVAAHAPLMPGFSETLLAQVVPPSDLEVQALLPHARLVHPHLLDRPAPREPERKSHRRIATLQGIELLGRPRVCAFRQQAARRLD